LNERLKYNFAYHPVQKMRLHKKKRE